MYVDELMIQKEYVDKIICAIADRYQYGRGGYRIEQKTEHDVTGVCGLYEPDTDDRLLGTEKDMCMLFFLTHEKRCMMEAISKCQKENKREIVGKYEEFQDQAADKAKELTDEMAVLYRKLSTRKQIQKAEGGYDIIVTQTSRIDKALLDTLYRKFSRDYENFQRNKKDCGQIEIDYEPAMDYTQYDRLSLRECLCKLEEKGVAAEWKR